MIFYIDFKEGVVAKVTASIFDLHRAFCRANGNIDVDIEEVFVQDSSTGPDWTEYFVWDKTWEFKSLQKMATGFSLEEKVEVHPFSKGGSAETEPVVCQITIEKVKALLLQGEQAFVAHFAVTYLPETAEE